MHPVRGTPPCLVLPDTPQDPGWPTLQVHGLDLERGKLTTSQQSLQRRPGQCGLETLSSSKGLTFFLAKSVLWDRDVLSTRPALCKVLLGWRHIRANPPQARRELSF